MSETINASDFVYFIAAHKDRVDYFASRFNLEPQEVQNSAFLAWSEANDTFDCNHGSRASFTTFVFAILKRMLQIERGRVPFVRTDSSSTACDFGDDDTFVAETGNLHSSPGESPELAEVSIEGVRFYEIGMDTLSLEPANSVNEQLEGLLTRSYADLVFKDVIRAHPVYAHEVYGKVIDGILAKSSVDAIASNIGCTTRRIHQAITRILHVLERRDPILDDRLIDLKGDESIEADPVRYRTIDSLCFDVPVNLDRDYVVTLAASILQDGVIVPIVIDQFGRVVKGAKRLIAAKLVGLHYVKTILRPITEGSSSRSDDAFERLRSAINLDSPPRINVIAPFQNLIEGGAMSVLVGTRLAAIPSSAQYLVNTRLGGLLIRLLALKDAHDLVSAHDQGNLDKHLVQLKTVLHKKLMKLIAD